MEGACWGFDYGICVICCSNLWEVGLVGYDVI